MVKVWRILRLCNGNTLVILCCLGLIAFVYFSIRIIELSISKNTNNCTYSEPIDVVYTWVNGSDPHFLIQMSKYLSHKKDSIDSSKKRFDDKNELRFSLRSLEKYAPWINHVYLVTNGQIPYWLNLDNEKISIVTHDVIFRDKDNLPTFSSPAIESNLHRIPGLSNKFIYFNDDIFLGQPLYLEDFYTINKGFLIFLAYILPNCANNCPWLYVGDGQCDLSCNTEKCQFDGGDCDQKNGVPVFYSEEVISEEKVDSNFLINQEIEILRQKIQSNLERERSQKFKLNSSYVQLNTSVYIGDTLNKLRVKTDEKPGIRVPRNVNSSIPKLVAEHNKKIMLQNKKRSRKRRSLYKGRSLEDSIRRFLTAAPRNIDGFLESLMYTQRMFNKKYEFKPRYVPAHAPIFLQKDIFQKLEEKFLTEFELTESNRFRHDDDVQFGFSYYYFLMSETVEKSVDDVFEDFDTDKSGTWSDREIRNLLARIYELPLSYEIVDNFEAILLNCSELRLYPEASAPAYERYIDSKLPTISKIMITECPFLSQYLQNKFGKVPKYKYQEVKDAEKSIATFRMLVSNITNVVIKLDEIRKHMGKFVCLNDNLDESKPTENDMIRAIIYDFYLSLFPHTSQFELPEDSRNRFLHISELNEWRKRHFIVKISLSLAIVSLIIVTFFNVFRKGCCKVLSELFC